ncbi:hypothetical protein GCM10023083_15500 [Streptomyces phyllanthi]
MTGSGLTRRRAKGTSTIPETGGTTAKNRTPLGTGAMRPQATSRSMPEPVPVVDEVVADAQTAGRLARRRPVVPQLREGFESAQQDALLRGHRGSVRTGPPRPPS